MPLLTRTLFVLLLACGGCATTGKLAEPRTICWSSSISHGAEAWGKAFEKRYGVFPVVLCVHGADLDGKWQATPDAPLKTADMESVAQTIHALYPDKPLLIVSCNPGGYRLHVAGCYYATDLVWSTPGDDERFCLQSLSFDHCVGRIEEFIRSHP